MDFMQALVTAQYALTMLSSAFNGLFFWSYRSPRRSRRMGAAALFLVSIAIFMESLYFGLFALLGDHGHEAFILAPGRWAVHGLVCLGSLVITALILRQVWRGVDRGP